MGDRPPGAHGRRGGGLGRHVCSEAEQAGLSLSPQPPAPPPVPGHPYNKTQRPSPPTSLFWSLCRASLALPVGPRQPRLAVRGPHSPPRPLPGPASLPALMPPPGGPLAALCSPPALEGPTIRPQFVLLPEDPSSSPSLVKTQTHPARVGLSHMKHKVQAVPLSVGL